MAFAATLAEKRGPRVGDAASLWNFTPAPGWTREEVQILRLCLMKHGVGQWLQILNTGLLPGKLIQQLNGQTQRLLGQQSLAAFTGLRVDVDRIRLDNESRTDATRKAGLIIYDGPTLAKEMKAELREEAQRKYGLTPEQLQKVDEQLEDTAAAFRAGAGLEAGAAGGSGASAFGGSCAADLELVVSRLDPEMVDLMAQPTAQLSPEQLILLLKRLRNRLACLTDRHRVRLDLPPRITPRWEGEGDAAVLLTALEETSARTTGAGGVDGAGGGAGPASSWGPDADGLAGGANSRGDGATAGGVPGGGRHLLAEATACRVRSGTAGAPPRPPSMGSMPGAAARKRTAKPGGKAPRGGIAAASSGGSGAYSDEWSGGEENAGPSGSRAAGAGRSGAGAKRKAGVGGGGVVAEGPGARRATRAKRPAARYDKYIDDGEYDEMDPDELDGAYGGGGGVGGSGGRGCPVDPSEALQKLTAMGFTPRKARGALQDCNFNVEAAVEWLVANCV